MLLPPGDSILHPLEPRHKASQESRLRSHPCLCQRMHFCLPPAEYLLLIRQSASAINTGMHLLLGYIPMEIVALHFGLMAPTGRLLGA